MEKIHIKKSFQHVCGFQKPSVPTLIVAAGLCVKHLQEKNIFFLGCCQGASRSFTAGNAVMKLHATFPTKQFAFICER